MTDDNAAGTLLGLACGDALGRPVEFKPPSLIRRRHRQVTEMLGNGTYGKPPGTITDDGDQALAIARSLAENGSFDPDDIAERFVEWRNSGPFDIGITTSTALRKIAGGLPWEEAGERALEERGEGSGAGNGSVMRCAPIAVAYADAPSDRLAEVSRISSRITHADRRCTDGAATLNVVIAAHLADDPDPFQRGIDWLEDNYNDTSEVLLSRLVAAKESPKETEELPNGGYVVDTMETALTLAHRTDSAEEAIIEAVNLGGDADTVGAVTGAVAGARFGAADLPDDWIDAIDEANEIRHLAEMLADIDFD